MIPFRSHEPLWRRATKACLRAIRVAVRLAFVLLLVALPIPLLPVRPRRGKPERHDEPGQVKPRE